MTGDMSAVARVLPSVSSASSKAPTSVTRLVNTCWAATGDSAASVNAARREIFDMGVVSFQFFPAVQGRSSARAAATDVFGRGTGRAGIQGIAGSLVVLPDVRQVEADHVAGVPAVRMVDQEPDTFAGAQAAQAFG